MTNEELTRRALAEVSARRQRAVTQAGQALERAQAALPELASLTDAQAQAGIQAARLAATGAEQAAVEAALAEARRLERQRAELLTANGFDVAPHYTCPICQDTGRAQGGLCECVRALVRQMRQSEVNAASPLELSSFETFDLARYPDRWDQTLGQSVRAHMETVYGYCRDWSRSFSRRSTSLYLYGYAGLGKTHLALAMARCVLEQGFNVVYVSAQNAFETVEKERFGAEGNTLDTLLEADLLILDDLGTEFLSPYVTSCLYSLINTRVCRSLPTIYTTNIVKDADMQRRYPEKIVSRLLGSCELLYFCGEDIRLQEK